MATIVCGVESAHNMTKTWQGLESHLIFHLIRVGMAPTTITQDENAINTLHICLDVLGLLGLALKTSNYFRRTHWRQVNHKFYRGHVFTRPLILGK